MTSRSKIPSTIEPYLQLPPESSLVLVTGTLVCSANWLTALFAGSFFFPQAEVRAADSNGSGHNVMFVSWMRDLHFWTDQIKRSTGHDVSKLVQQGHCAFLDCLGTSNAYDTNHPLDVTERAITAAISKLSSHGSRVSIILDNPDILLATRLATLQQLNAFVMKFRMSVHSMVISCSADLPMVSASVQAHGPSSPVELDTAAFITQQAHAAQVIMSARELSSGAARDVSGILRVTRGGDRGFEDSSVEVAEELEALYFVQRDGGVKVFGRGEEMA